MATGRRILLITLLCLATNSVISIEETTLPAVTRQPGLKIQNATLVRSNAIFEISPALLLQPVVPVPEESATENAQSTLIPMVKLQKAADVPAEISKAKEIVSAVKTQDANKVQENSELETTLTVPTTTKEPTTTTEPITTEAPTTTAKPATTEAATTTAGAITTEPTEPGTQSTELTSPGTTGHTTDEPTTTSGTTLTPHSTTQEPSTTAAPSHHQLTKGEITAVVIFTLIFVSALSGGVVYIIRRRRMRSESYSRLVA